MIAIRRILCPIDFSDYSRRALDHAMAIARWYKSKITVLHVFSPPPVASFGPGPLTLEPVALTAADREHLFANTKRFAESESPPGVAIDTVVREGNTAGEILDQAAGMQADLLVIGTHGRAGFERALLGSVAEKVLRKASCPVMTVPRQVPDAMPVGPILYRGILCPVDFSESSLHALTYAISLARETGAQLTVLHVVAQEFEDSGGLEYDAGMTVGDFLKAREDALQRCLQELVASVPESCRAETLMTHGKPWRDVLRVAAERHSDLVVIGVRGRGPADLLFLGSTTQHVVREAACPVLTIRRG